MSKIELSDQLYKQVTEAARAQRMSMEKFVSEAIKVYMEEEPETPNLDHLFTPEVMAAIDRGAQQAREGRTFSMDEVRQHFDQLSREWDKKLG